MDEQKVLPLLTPLLALLKSRKFLVAVLTLGVDCLIAQVPSLAPSKDVLVAAFTALGSVVIGSIAHEDASKF